MQELILGIFTIAIGGIFCFAGYATMRILFPIWGLVAGFWLGAQLVNQITGDGLFGTTLSIIVGIAVAIIGAIIAYLYYSISVIMFMGFIGYWIGAGIFTLFGWDLTIASAILGIALGLVFIASAIIGNAPKEFLLLITSFGGAALLVSGALVLINVVPIEELQDGPVAAAFNHGLFWKLTALGLWVTGWVSQIASVQKAELNWAAEWKKETAGTK